jgi:hypothetical protein
MDQQNYRVREGFMDIQIIGKSLYEAAKPGLRLAVKDMIIKVVVPVILDPVLNKVKTIIPGTFDDVIIEGFRPKAKEALVALAGKI